MGTKSLWLEEEIPIGNEFELPEATQDLDPYQGEERPWPQLIVDVVCDTPVFVGHCFHLGQCLTPGSVEMPTTMTLETLIEDTGLYHSALIFETYDAEDGRYSTISSDALVKAVAVTANDPDNNRPSFKAAIVGVAWCLIEPGVGQYVTFPDKPGLGKLCISETDVKVLGLRDGITSVQGSNTFALVGLGLGGGGKIRLGQLTSSAQAGAVTWKALEVFDDGSTSPVGDDIAGIILGDYT